MLGQSNFYKAIRQFAVQTPVWGTAIRYRTTPDESYDLTLTSRRVYGTPDEYLAIMAAAGLDTFDQEMTERDLVLPTQADLEKIKAQTGYESPSLPSIR